MESPPSIAAPETVSANLRMLLRGLLAALGAWAIEPMMAVVLYRRISRTLNRIERMVVRFRAGTLWRVTHRDGAPGRRAAGMRATRLPRRFGWLVQTGGHQAAGFGAQLLAVLNTPEMAELLAASAQAGRILRPLCRALAVELPGIGGTSRKVATQSSTTARRKCRPRTALEPFHIPLPRGVIGAARREGFGKDR